MTTMIKPVGTFDHDRPVVQMLAIDVVMRHYFGTGDWLRARNLARRKNK